MRMLVRALFAKERDTLEFIRSCKYSYGDFGDMILTDNEKGLMIEYTFKGQIRCVREYDVKKMVYTATVEIPRNSQFISDFVNQVIYSMDWDKRGEYAPIVWDAVRYVMDHEMAVKQVKIDKTETLFVRSRDSVLTAEAEIRLNKS
jgi:hypothetical protein